MLSFTLMIISPQILSLPMRTLLLAASFLLATLILAQDDPRVFTPYAAGRTVLPKDTPAVDSVAPGKITLHEGEQITDLMNSYTQRKHPLKGFRLQIYLGERTKAEDVRRQFLTRHPETPAYLSYLAPNFRVRVGDQRNKREAEKLREQLLDEFPGSYVVPDEIEMPRLPDLK
jgi:hypothetical protein